MMDPRLGSEIDKYNKGLGGASFGMPGRDSSRSTRQTINRTSTAAGNGDCNIDDSDEEQELSSSGALGRPSRVRGGGCPRRGGQWSGGFCAVPQARASADQPEKHSEYKRRAVTYLS
jgi:hypothetical protein